MRRSVVLGALLVIVVVLTRGVAPPTASAAFICLEVQPPAILEYGPYQDSACSIPVAKEKFILTADVGVKLAKNLYCVKVKTAGLGFHEVANCSDATVFGGKYIKVIAVPAKCPFMEEEVEP